MSILKRRKPGQYEGSVHLSKSWTWLVSVSRREGDDWKRAPIDQLLSRSDLQKLLHDAGLNVDHLSLSHEREVYYVGINQYKGSVGSLGRKLAKLMGDRLPTYQSKPISWSWSIAPID
jgi:hypothetical protein